MLLAIPDNPSKGGRTELYKAETEHRKGSTMLWTLFVILLVLWLVGVVSSYTLGGFIHLLLVLAVLALVFQLLTDRPSSI